jgi:hypothetical protein
MVTMSSEKAAARRKADSNNGGQAGPAVGSGALAAAASSNEDSPNQLVYKKVSCWVKVVLQPTVGNWPSAGGRAPVCINPCC